MKINNYYYQNHFYYYYYHYYYYYYYYYIIIIVIIIIIIIIIITVPTVLPISSIVFVFRTWLCYYYHHPHPHHYSFYFQKYQSIQWTTLRWTVRIDVISNCVFSEQVFFFRCREETYICHVLSGVSRSLCCCWQLWSSRPEELALIFNQKRPDSKDPTFPPAQVLKCNLQHRKWENIGERQQDSHFPYSSRASKLSMQKAS